MQPSPQDQLNASAENPLKPAGQYSPPPGHPGLSPPCTCNVHRGWFVQRRRVVYLSGAAADVELIEVVQPELAGLCRRT
jgi:hypothetical protein